MNKEDINKEKITQETIDKTKKLILLRDILLDFDNNYTGVFRDKLQRSINKLHEEIFKGAEK